MKVVFYLRVSSTEQHTDNQLPALEAFAQARGWEVAEVYQENVSAWASGRQAELHRLLDDCQNGRKPDIILIYDLSRLSRQGIASVLNLVKMFEVYGIKVVSVKEPWTETEGPMKELLFAVFAWAAQYESRIKSERTLAGLTRARAEGKQLGRPKGSKDKEKRSSMGYLLRYHRPSNKRGLRNRREAPAVTR
jgi:DNA invertase Pin-like site-specific DNA recombinase